MRPTKYVQKQIMNVQTHLHECALTYVLDAMALALV